MAKREFSSTLKNLKFMQRAAKKEEKPKEEEAKLKEEDSFGSSAALSRKCIVIMEGNPHPGAVKGRMSFHNFNSSIDNMNQEAATIRFRQACDSIIENQSVTTSDRDDRYPTEPTNAESPENCPETDLKRKQPEVETEGASHPKNSQQNLSRDGGRCSSSQHNSKGPQKQQKRENREKLNWNVLRPPKVQTKRD